MKADLSRSTFSPAKHFHDVRLQQGRVQLDADWNEQIDIAAHRVETETIDVIGSCGAPEGNAAFDLVAQVADLPSDQQAAATALGALATGDFFLSAGRFYAHGVLCENDAPVKYSAQPDLPGGSPLGASGLYLAYLDVWPRLLTFLDDPSIREVALNGPDTAARVKTISQVKLVSVGATGATPDCSADYPAYDLATAAPTGQLSARAEPNGTSTEPCIIAPGAGYRSLENQLYRVEVHQHGSDGVATFKWSRDDGAVVARWQPTATANIIQLQRPPPDDALGFAVGQWVEITDDACDLNGVPGILVAIKHVDPQYLTLDLGSQSLSKFTLNPKVRRWDSSNAADTAGDITITAGGWIALEDGVQVQFASGSFRTGDYWLIPARTATANVEWPADASGNPIPSLPHGIPHVYCMLGFVDFNGTTIVPTECRSLFPPLTAVQPGCNLKLHNQHLHGWGVVCGLQVHCAGDRTQVAIEPGHAIACDGTDILLKSAQNVAVVSPAQSLGLLDSAKSGSVAIELTADNNDNPVFTVVAPPVDPAKTFLQQILEGTLWMDFYQDCLQPLVAYYKANLGVNAADTKLVPDNKRRLTAAINLLYQFTNPAAGRVVWLSSAEHSLLQTAYNDLRALLSSNTFCAIEDNLVAFPSYPFSSLNISTVFGKTPLAGARFTPDGATVVAFDNGTTGSFYLFDVASGEMTAALAVPGAAPLTVRDVLVFGGTAAPQLLVAATGGGNTTLAVFDLASRQAVGSPYNFYGIEVSRLETSPFDNTSALAVVVGRGLYTLDPAGLSTGSLTHPLVAFNAAGHLAVSGNFVAASVAAQGTVTPYTSLMLGNLDASGGGLKDFPLKGLDGSAAQGTSGLAVIKGAPAQYLSTVYVGVDAASGQTNKRVLGLNSEKGATVADLALPTGGGIALATNGQQLLVGLTEECKLLWIDPIQNVVDATQALPAQIAPVAIATLAGPVSPKYVFKIPGRKNPGTRGTALPPVIAVNRLSQTLTVIPASLVGIAPDPVDFNALGAYRDGIVAAFKDLFFRLVQGLKDCLCDRLLLDCPQCGPADVIYLATVEIRSGQVYHICNFIRRDVLTFPKVKYWLSAVPVIPVIHWLVQKFCCSVLPELSLSIDPANYLAAPTFGAIFEKIQTRNFTLNSTDTFKRYAAVGKFAAQAFVTRAVLPSSAAPAGTLPSVLLQASPDSAKAMLTNQGVAVANVADVHTALASNLPLIDASAMPLDLQPGDQVNLYTQNGRVVYYTRVAASPAPAPAAAAGAGATPGAGVGDVQGLQNEIVLMRTQLASLQQAHAAALSQISVLNTTTAALKTNVAALSRG